MNSIEIEKKKWEDYRLGLKEAMRPNFKNCPWISEEDIPTCNDVYNAILENTFVEDITSFLEDSETKGAWYYSYVALPLLQAFDFTSINMITVDDAKDISNKYQGTDIDTIVNFLSELTCIGRERLLNVIEIPQAMFPKVNKAIVAMDREALTEILESPNLDFSWLAKIAGIKNTIVEILDLLSASEQSDEFIFDIFQQITASVLQDVDNFYLKEYFDLNNDIEELSEKKIAKLPYIQTKLVVKGYWYQRHIYTKGTQNIIDDYLSKPYFVSLIKECRAEFEADEKERKTNSDGNIAWLPENFFKDDNLWHKTGKNHLNKIRDAVIRGWSKKEGPANEEEMNGDGRKKIGLLINKCAELNFISDDDDTKARMAYVLTGRYVGFDIVDKKPLKWNGEYRKYLFYLLKNLFGRGPYKDAFRLIDGIGDYIFTENHSELAEELGKNDSFRLFVHDLYPFCKETRTKYREGKHLKRTQSKKEKEEPSEES